MLSADLVLGCLARKDNSVRFLYCGNDEMPFYEEWFDATDITFVEAEKEEIDLLCKKYHQIQSEVLIVKTTGMAHYQAYEDIIFRSAEFDLKLIQEILTSKN